MSKTINLTESSILKAIDGLKQLQRTLILKEGSISKELALIGLNEATVRFEMAQYDGVKDYSLNIIPILNGYRVTASGKTVLFIEFGTGVYYNHGEGYPEGKPDGVSGIGEYGLGKGKQWGWGYYEGKNLHLTRGNPASMPMYYAKEEIKNQVLQVIRKELSL